MRSLAGWLHPWLCPVLSKLALLTRHYHPPRCVQYALHSLTGYDPGASACLLSRLAGAADMALMPVAHLALKVMAWKGVARAAGQAGRQVWMTRARSARRPTWS